MPRAARIAADLAHRHDLARQVGDVQQSITFVRGVIAPIEPSTQIVLRRRRHGKRDLLDDDAVAARALVPRVEHARVVLVRRTTSSPGFRSRPSCAISFASHALRVMAISSGSQPNSRASRRRTVSMFGSSTRHMWYDGASFEMSRSRLCLVHVARAWRSSRRCSG